MVADPQRRRGARRAGRVRPRTPTLDDNARGDDEARASACAPARSRRRCATPSSTCGPIATGDWIAHHARRHRARPRVAGRRRVRSCSTSSSTTTARSSPCSSAPTPRAEDTERIREHIEVDVPARRGRVPRRRPAAVPVPRRRGVAERGADRRSAAHAARAARDRRSTRAEGRRARARDAARRHGAAQRPRPARSTTRAATIDRTKQADIAELAVGEEATVDRRGAHGPRRGRTRNGQRAGRGRRLRRHVGCSTITFFNQAWREKQLARRHRGVVLRQARRVPRQAPDDEPGRRRLGRAGVADDEDRRDRARLPAVGEGRGVHLAAARARRRRAREVHEARGFADPLDDDAARPRTTSSTATRALRAHPPARVDGGAAARPQQPAEVRRVPAHAGRPRRAQARARRRGVGDPPRRRRRRSSPRSIARLPFALTGDQQRGDRRDHRTTWRAPAPMHRLLQGDVGSGKTVVALAALLVAVQGGYQGAFMAPTEVLAEQHDLGSRAAARRAHGRRPRARCSATGRCGSRCSPTGRPRPSAGASPTGSRAGEVDILVGTHALLYGDVEFTQPRRRGDRRAAPLRRRAARAAAGQGRRSPTCW